MTRTTQTHERKQRATTHGKQDNLPLSGDSPAEQIAVVLFDLAASTASVMRDSPSFVCPRLQLNLVVVVPRSLHADAFACFSKTSQALQLPYSLCWFLPRVQASVHFQNGFSFGISHQHSGEVLEVRGVLRCPRSPTLLRRAVHLEREVFPDERPRALSMQVVHVGFQQR